MKYTDVQKLHAAGLITDEQLQRIVAHFGLKEDSNRLLVIISFVGAVLVAASRAVTRIWNGTFGGIKKLASCARRVCDN